MGEIRTNDAELTVKYENGKGETGMLLGVNARPNVNEKGESERFDIQAGAQRADHCLPEVPLRRPSELGLSAQEHACICQCQYDWSQ